MLREVASYTFVFFEYNSGFIRYQLKLILLISVELHLIDYHIGRRFHRAGSHIETEADRGATVILLGGVRPSAIGGEEGTARPDNVVRGVGRRDGGSDGLSLSLD